MTEPTLTSTLECADRFTLNDVPFNGGLVDVAFAKELWLPHTQFEFVENYDKSEFRLPACDLYFAVIKRLIAKTDSKEERTLLDTLRSDVKGHIMTGSQVLYAEEKPEMKHKKDMIAHDWNTTHERVVSGLNLIGPLNYIESIPEKESISQAYFGSSAETMIAVLKEFSGKHIYHQRRQQRSELPTERPVCFSVNQYNFFINAESGMDFPSRGIVVQKK